MTILWATDMVAKIDAKWMEVSGDASPYPADLKKSGYAVFYSPVRKRPPLLILGLNPGGGEKDFDRNANRKIPDRHEYLCADYKLARLTRGLFREIGFEGRLAESVKSNLLFFSTKHGIEDWKRVPEPLRTELRNLCEDGVREMVDKLRPQSILLEGIGTYERFRDFLFPKMMNSQSEPVVGPDGWIYVSNKLQGTPVIGILHLSGARGTTNETISMIGKALRKDLALIWEPSELG